ncbi:flotillin family protein [Halalkalibacter hemicellulosilyticus]|uniref:Epidermal surface antigen n=1 Tax=Halalkalibacter hemicellulosilyticusJCM 9152 TaxID=1236971 RepID=W4QEF1_9BACI|nr:flotillin family protein [Halalkalibacter hemicellulosilyticus]GAE30048.1 epidermal surface antigen [Halalkalibacter hemicellulosilyticusJCM 9152]
MIEMLWLSIIGIILFILLIIGIVVFIIFKLRYKTASTNQALIITGPNLGNPDEDSRIFVDENGRSMKIIRGGGVRLKLFQTCTPVDLNSFQIKLTTPKVYTSQGVPVIADAVTSVKIADSLIGVANYAEQFLGKKQKEIEDEVSKVLGTNLRAILSKLSVTEINNDRESFNHQVQEIAQEELDNMGFKITSFGLDDLRDTDEENGYLENLGRPRIAEIRKKAEMAESDAEKETRIYRAKNDQEAQDEENRRLTAIAESRKEKDVKEAQIKEETERARAKSEQSYELEKAKLAQQVKEEEMQIQYIERQRQVQLQVEEQKRRKALADADAYDIKARAEAEAEKARIDGETKATIEKQKGLAEAEVIRERGRAEAEAKELMAQAMEKFGEAAILEMFIQVLPKYAHEIAKPLSQIEEMKVFDFGGSDSNGGASKITSNVTKTMLGLQESLKETTGMDLKEMLETYVSRGRNQLFEEIKETASTTEYANQEHTIEREDEENSNLAEQREENIDS